MSPARKTAFAAQVIMSAGSDINDEVTILLNSALEAEEAAGRKNGLVEIKRSAQRLAYLAADLLRCGRDQGARVQATTVDQLVGL